MFSDVLNGLGGSIGSPVQLIHFDYQYFGPFSEVNHQYFILSGPGCWIIDLLPPRRQVIRNTARIWHLGRRPTFVSFSKGAHYAESRANPKTSNCTVWVIFSACYVTCTWNVAWSQAHSPSLRFCPSSWVAFLVLQVFSMFATPAYWIQSGNIGWHVLAVVMVTATVVAATQSFCGTS